MLNCNLNNKNEKCEHDGVPNEKNDSILKFIFIEKCGWK